MTSPPVTDEAVASADRAAAAAGVRIRPAVSAAEATAAREVLDAVFQPAPGEHEASVELLCAFAHAGQYLVLAEDLATGQPLGTSMGFFHEPARRTLHSHATAVVGAGRGRRLGRAIKLHQRAWALERDLDTVTWTFDPLVRRNAWFNLSRLGARTVSFEPNFYGEMTDGVNAGDESDRFVVDWRLREPLGSPPVPAAGAVRLLTAGPGDEPRRAALPPGARVAVAQIPADIEALRAADARLSLRWRRDLRAVLTEAAAAGLAVTGITADGWYVLAAAG